MESTIETQESRLLPKNLADLSRTIPALIDAYSTLNQKAKSQKALNSEETLILLDLLWSLIVTVDVVGVNLVRVTNWATTMESIPQETKNLGEGYLHLKESLSRHEREVETQLTKQLKSLQVLGNLSQEEKKLKSDSSRSASPVKRDQSVPKKIDLEVPIAKTAKVRPPPYFRKAIKKLHKRIDVTVTAITELDFKVKLTEANVNRITLVGNQDSKRGRRPEKPSALQTLTRGGVSRGRSAPSSDSRSRKGEKKVQTGKKSGKKAGKDKPEKEMIAEKPISEGKGKTNATDGDQKSVKFDNASKKPGKR